MDGSGVLEGGTGNWEEVVMHVVVEVVVFMLMGCFVFVLVGLGFVRDSGTVGFGFGFVVLVFLGLAGMIGRGIRGRGLTVESWPGVDEVGESCEGTRVLEEDVE
jgi:hypothetical protein